MNILAVDDERIGLAALMSSIKGTGMACDVCGFRNAKEAFEKAQTQKFDVAILDIQLKGSTTGVELAEMLMEKQPGINIIFATGYDEYQQKAFKMHASGYILKPVTVEKVRDELENLRYPVNSDKTAADKPKELEIRAFGNFEVFFDGKPLKFKYEKTRELLAYLVDKNGAFCSNGEIAVALWEDENHESYLRGMKKDLHDSLVAIGCEDIILVQRGRLAIVPSKVQCDYYKYLAGDSETINHYRGEYMNRYSWAEVTNAGLMNL